ncbi:unnamed protein product [Musa acuminata subsp. burmannicoides]
MGPSPVTFFTVLAVALALDFYCAVSGFLEPQPQVPRDRGAGERETVEPLPLPVQLGEITEEELRAYDGSGPNSRSSWPSRARSMTSPRAGCFMDLVDHMHFVLAKMQVEH